MCCLQERSFTYLLCVLNSAKAISNIRYVDKLIQIQVVYYMSRLLRLQVWADRSGEIFHFIWATVYRKLWAHDMMLVQLA
jgi:hypothetical protein